VVASGVDAAVFTGLQQRQQAAACHIAWNLDSGGLEDGRGYVDQADEVGDHAAAWDTCGPADGQRNTGPVVVEVRLGARKRHAVVTGDDDDGIRELTSLF